MNNTVLKEDPSRLAKQAAIRRASAKARRAMDTVDADALRDLKRIYREAVDQLSRNVSAVASSDGTVKLEVMQRLLSQASAGLKQLEDQRDAILSNGLNAGATVGTQAFAAESAVLNASLTNLATDAVSFVRNFVAADGLQLSDRIWINDKHARRVVQEAIEQAVIQGNSASQAAREFLARGESIPGNILNKMNAAQTDKIINDIKRGLMNAPGSPMSNALRLMRTEINRAHGMAYQNTAFSHPDVVGTRFLLSPSHPRPDVCDMHARVNRYGLGPGVYPKGKSPWPAHPNTKSYEETVFIDQISSDDRAGKETRIDWLNKQRLIIQENVLGSRKKRMALDRGLLKENHINTPWKVLLKRYEAKGYLPDKWQLPTPLNPVIKPSANQISSVSSAFNVVGQKKAVAETLSAIDEVHSDGVLPLIPIKSSSSKRTLGQYRHYIGSGKAVDIAISSKGTHKTLTAAHEIGHFIDHQAIGDTGRFASQYDPIMEKWWQAVQKSDAFKGINRITAGPRVVDLDGYPYTVDMKHAKYLLQRHELWARSYAQYIAQKSNSALMKQELKGVLTGQQKALFNYHHQWQEADFKQISNAMDDIIEALNWTK